MDSQEEVKRLDFPRWCRELRLARHLKQRQVAVGLGIAPKSYANVESNNHKTISSVRAERLAAFYQLTALTHPTRLQFLNAWAALPASDYAERMGDRNAKRRAVRSKVAAHDRMRTALIEVTTLLITSSPEPDSLCTCPDEEDPDSPPDFWNPPEPQQPCELCSGLEALGLPRWSSADDAISQLSALQQKDPR